MKASRSLVEMEIGREGVVSEIQGGIGLVPRLDALGIRPGVVLQKISGSYLRGPVTVKVGNSRMAVGFGMAGKIILDIEEIEEKEE